MSNKLVISMNTEEGKKNFSFPHAKSSPSASSVKALAQSLITNGSIYATPPLSVVSAKIVITTENSIDIE